ncbi:MAG: rhodanese-like domain-containing protein [Actinomycetota bacterium]|nr:rhodanese-like domain-containing protein [Actinomycetota bacterium]
MTRSATTRAVFVVVLALSVLLTACSSSTATQSIELVSPAAAAQVIADDPADLVILDIRTLEEFNEARLADAIMVDFYADDFADQLDTLDKDVPYVMYCRTGNRTSEAVKTMKELGFVEVYEIEGGIVNWYEQGYPIES